MASTVVMALFRFGDDIACCQFSELLTYESMVDFACRRWSALRKDNIKLSYDLGGDCCFLLHNEDDFKNMCIMVVRGGKDAFEIHIKRLNSDLVVGESSLSSGTTSTVTSSGLGRGSSSLTVSDVTTSEVNTSAINRTDFSSSVVSSASVSKSSFSRNDKQLLSSTWSRSIQGIGQFFQGGASHFRNELRKFAYEVVFEITFLNNDKTRVSAKCTHQVSKGCLWRIHASIDNSNGWFYIRTYNSNHTCGDVFKCGKKRKMINSTVVADIILNVVRDKPCIGATDVCHKLKKEYGVDVSYKVCWKGVEKARDKVFGESSMSYNRLKDYFAKLKEADPHSHYSLEFDPETSRFKRCFVTFGACLHGFRFCRPLLMIDGTFLGSKYKGTLLSATAKDATNGLFNIAFAIVGSEDKDNWNWFLQMLRPHIAERVVTFVSDRHLGIISSVRDVFPESFHSFCKVHLINNLKDKLKGCSKESQKGVVKKFKKSFKAPTKEMFHLLLNEMTQLGGKKVSDFFDNLPYENFADPYFQGRRYGEYTSNAAESFNSQMKEGCTLPVAELIDFIRLKLMAQMSERRVESSKWSSVLCPSIEKKWNKLFDKGRTWTIVACSDSTFDVQSDPSMVVDTQHASCSCGKWQYRGFPCKHAIAVLSNTTEEPFAYIEDYFSTKNYQLSYALSIPYYTSFGQVAVDEEPVILPPLSKRPPGRPKQKRIPSRGEYSKRKIRCSRCQQLGHHNRKSCTQPLIE